jgi:hypothetical protein
MGVGKGYFPLPIQDSWLMVLEGVAWDEDPVMEQVVSSSDRQSSP